MNGAADSLQESDGSADRDQSFEISRIDSWDDLMEFLPAWSELVERTPSATVLQTFEWHQSWWQTFGSVHELFVILCHKNGQLFEIAPMMITLWRNLTHRIANSCDSSAA